MKNKKSIVDSREEVVSMFLGLGVVVLVVVVIINFIVRAKGNISVPGISTKVESNSLYLANKIDSSVTGSYVVKAGDSLWKIAKSTYGDGDMWVKIAKENKLKTPSSIEIGQQLLIPTSVPVLSQVTNTEVKNNVVADTYQVKAGDSLWKIAMSQFNDGFKWTEIWNLNKDKIVNANQLEVGMILKLR